jgi:hypothetical protein
MRKPIREILAPCGLDCGKCLANPESPIARLARELRGELGGFAAYAGRFAEFNPAFGQYPAFAAMLDHLADGGACPSCRSGRCLFQGCLISRCTREKGLDYCSECAEFPCAQANLPAHLDALWRTSTAAIRELGPEGHYATITDRPRYAVPKKR